MPDDFLFVGMFQTNLVIAFWIAGITCSVGQGFQFQALMYILVVVFAGFSYEQFFSFTLMYAVVFVFSSIFRISKG